MLAEVVGRIWNDRQLDGLDGHRLVVVRDLHTGTLAVAADPLEVARGNTVLVTTDEAAQAVAGSPAVDAAVVGLVGGADELDSLRAGTRG
jgi:ethanolamine utilization protein EutN